MVKFGFERERKAAEVLLEATQGGQKRMKQWIYVHIGNIYYSSRSKRKRKTVFDQGTTGKVRAGKGQQQGPRIHRQQTEGILGEVRVTKEGKSDINHLA